MRLADCKNISFWRGNIFRVRGKHPYEAFVDFMIFESQVEDCSYGLIVTSGYKAGLILAYLPVESTSVEGGLDKEWVVSNWKKRIYPDCDVSDVYFVDGYESVLVN